MHRTNTIDMSSGAIDHRLRQLAGLHRLGRSLRQVRYGDQSELIDPQCIDRRPASLFDLPSGETKPDSQ